jgi:hypothetical protein
MATAPNFAGEPQKVKVAGDAGQRLREAGFSEPAITAWWMLLVDPKIKETAHRVWESGDFATLNRLVDKTLQNKANYRSALETLASEHWAERLSQSKDVQDRLLGANI